MYDDEDESVENTKDVTPELMQYDDDEDDDDDVDNVNSSENEEVQRAQSENGGDVDSLHLEQNIRSKSVPTTPTLNGTNNQNAMSLPLSLDPTANEMKKDELQTSQTPKWNQSASDLRTQKMEVTETKKRSKSEDGADPTLPNLIPQIDVQSKSTMNLKEKIPKSSKKKKRRKKETDIKLNKTFSKNKKQKQMDEKNAMKPVIESTITKYSTRNLQAPNNQKSRNSISGKSDRKLIEHMPPIYSQYQQQSAQRQRMEMQQHIAQSKHVLVNPYRQFSIAFNQRPFNIKLQFRNGFNAFMNPSSYHIQQSRTLTRTEYIWGWYLIESHQHIPIGSKLISINFESIQDKSYEQITDLMYNSPLPTTLIFEAPSYLKHVPPSIHIQICDDDGSGEQNNVSVENHSQFSIVEYLRNKKNIIFWWLEEGGFIMLCLGILALVVLDIPWYTQFRWYLPVITALLTVFAMSISQS